MPDIVMVRVIWDRQEIQQPVSRRYFRLHVAPSAEHPFGQKGLAIASAWKQLGTGKDPAGLLIMDGDVAVDGCDHDAMIKAIDGEPDAIWIAPAKLWPVSTRWGSWAWAHGCEQPSQVMISEGIRWFSFNFTYLPKALMAACLRDGLRSWGYPTVDVKVSATARKLGLAIKVVPGCWPKHMNY